MNKCETTAHILLVAALLATATVQHGHAVAEEGVPPAWQVAGFEAALRDPNPLVLVEAMRFPAADEILSGFDEQQAAALVALLGERLSNEDWDVRSAAAQALGALGTAAREQAPLLGELLSDEISEVRSAAAQALGALGPAARDQAPLLAERLSDEDSNVRDAAAQALGALGEAAQAQALLVERLSDEDSGVRAAAVQALGAMGEASKGQAPLLGGLLSDEDWGGPRCRGTSAGGAGRGGPGTGAALGRAVEFERRGLGCPCCRGASAGGAGAGSQGASASGRAAER
jgi:HEAT repeat protein